RRQYLRSLSEKFITDINSLTAVPSPSRSQIVPVIVGDASRALSLAERCIAGGFDCMAIRRPTVPPGGERLRISLNTTINDYDLAPLLEILGN
ncbi:MAG: hypothetical protein K2M03_08970, partial [Muribaculaceae bacterium]|nr:hypothetical protein [Muribaculaceae bacterium]